MSKNIIMTSRYNFFDFKDVENSKIDIEEIAHSLSNVCRFGGHCKHFYSVAQHSVLVSNLVPEPLALIGLLHDAAEAYLGDIPTPLKIMLPDYKRIEKRVEKYIAKYFGFEYKQIKDVREADHRALFIEKSILFPDSPHWDIFDGMILKDTEHLVPLPPILAEAAFLERYKKIIINH